MKHQPVLLVDDFASDRAVLGCAGCNEDSKLGSTENNMALQTMDFQQLVEMQVLCDKVLDQTEALALALETAQALHQGLKQLEDFYDRDWLRIYSDERLTDADHAALRPHIQDGRYSILSQDTIWDALQAARQAQLSLAKLLVKQL